MRGVPESVRKLWQNDFVKNVGAGLVTAVILAVLVWFRSNALTASIVAVFFFPFATLAYSESRARSSLAKTRVVPGPPPAPALPEFEVEAHVTGGSTSAVVTLTVRNKQNRRLSLRAMVSGIATHRDPSDFPWMIPPEPDDLYGAFDLEGHETVPLELCSIWEEKPTALPGGSMTYPLRLRFPRRWSKSIAVDMTSDFGMYSLPDITMDVRIDLRLAETGERVWNGFVRVEIGPLDDWGPEVEVIEEPADT